MLEIVKDRIKPPEVYLSGKLMLKSTSQNGIEVVKNSFKKAEEFAKEKAYTVRFSYISAPAYMLMITAPDYKIGEKILEEVSSLIVTEIKKAGGEGSFTKA